MAHSSHASAVGFLRPIPMKVLILGGTGMLGSMVAKVLPDEWEVLVTARTPAPYPYELVNTWWRRLAVAMPPQPAWREDLKRLADGCDWIVNCLGATKPLIGEDAAYPVNAYLPRAVDKLGPPAIHPSTDCVFDPRDRWDRETPHSEHDMASAQDPYGLSKRVGEDGLRNTSILRCSIVGPECRTPARHLLGSVIERSIDQGWAHHLWNGITTLAWAKIAMAHMEHPEILAGEHHACEGAWYPRRRLLHLVPAGSCSKDRLVSTILQAFRLRDRQIEARSGEVVDTRLATVHQGVIVRLWRAAGYDDAPTIEEMVWELADFCRAEHWPTHDRGWEYWNTCRT